MLSLSKGLGNCDWTLSVFEIFFDLRRFLSSIFKKSVFELHLTRKELAELAGMSTESVIRILKKFQEDNLVTITGKTFEISDPDGLQRICDLG